MRLNPLGDEDKGDWNDDKINNFDIGGNEENNVEGRRGVSRLRRNV